MLFFFLFGDQWGLQAKINLFRWSNGKLGEGIHKPVQSCVVTESSFGNTCIQLGIQIAEDVEQKEEPKNLLMKGKFSFHVMADREICTYVKNNK